MVTLHAGNMVVKVDRSFGVPEAIRLRDTVDRVAPLREVLIDFGAESVVEDRALLVIADLMKAHPRCRFQLGGLTNHGRRLLRYMGALHAPGPGAAPASSRAALEPMAAA